MQAKPDSPLGSMSGLLGAWTMESPQFPRVRGRTKVEWIDDGAYVAVRVNVDEGEIPSGTWIVGGDDASDDCTALYYDSRGVRRVYRMSLGAGEWRIWRDAPGFHQRFSGKLAANGSTISGQWEVSEDGSKWRKDFDLIYRRVGA
jgi:hypothetical protein